MRKLANLIRRYVSNRHELHYRMQRRQSYWVMSRYYEKFAVGVGNIFYNTRAKIKKRYDHATIFMKMLREVVLYPLIFSVFLLFTLEFLESVVWPYAYSSLISNGFNALELLPDITPSLDRQIGILAVIAQVAAVILGLYITATSVLISTGYSSAPANVRLILYQDKLSNLYVEILTLTGVSSVLLLVYNSLGGSFGILTFLIITALAIISLISIWHLGIRLFEFFNPSNLVGYILNDIRGTIVDASVNGFRWNNISFQAHYQKLTESKLLTVNEIATLITAMQSVSSESIKDTIIKVLTLQDYYGLSKSLIPLNSYWFRREPEHQDWVLSNSSEIELAINTNTFIQPSMKANSFWFEQEVDRIFSKLFIKAISQNDKNSIAAIGNKLISSFRTWGQSYSIDEGLNFYLRYKQHVYQFQRSSILSKEDLAENIPKAEIHLVISEQFGMLLVHFLIKLSESLTSMTVESFEKQFKKLRWDTCEAQPAFACPTKVRETIVGLQRGIRLELLVEGNRITPDWFLKQRISLSYRFSLQKILPDLLTALENVLVRHIETLIDEKRFFDVAPLLHWGIETTAKFQTHFALIKEWVKSMECYLKDQKEKGTDLNWNSFDQTIEKLRARLITGLSKATIYYSDFPVGSHYPDYFGQAYSLLADECYKSLARNETAKYNATFPAFFAAAHLMRTRLRDKMHDVSNTDRFIVGCTQSIVDAAHLSAYALLYSEIHANLELWEFTKARWDKYLEVEEEKVKFLHSLVFLLNDRNIKHDLSSIRGTIRFRWKRHFDEMLERRYFSEMDVRFSDWQQVQKVAKNASPIISVILEQHMISGFHYDAEDFFLIEYVTERNEMAGVKIPEKIKRIKDRLSEKKQAKI